MKIVYADESLTLKDSVVVLGNFDGVHIAHQVLIKKAVSISKMAGLKVVVYTFFEHPKIFFGKEVGLITDNTEKEAIFKVLGVDVLVYQRPSEEFLSMSPESFVENIVIKQLGAKFVIVGEHYTFGAMGSGDCRLLHEFASRFNVKTHIEKLVKQGNKLISSSNIRNDLRNGDIKEANTALGREYSISGEVIHGNKIGTEIGFPTANISIQKYKIIPKHGVYACKTIIDNIEYPSVANIGIKPTIGSEKTLVEVHVFGYNDDVYGKVVTVKICCFIREEKMFNNVNELAIQIKNDVEKALEYFSNIDK